MRAVFALKPGENGVAPNQAHSKVYVVRAISQEPDDERLRAHPRALLTPHVAYYSVEGFDEMRSKGAREARRVLEGEAVRNPVNVAWLKGPRAVVRGVS